MPGGDRLVATSARRGPKFRRRAEARPDEVLDAALALFTEKGFAATRVEDIARRAGISKGAVYLYFESKEAIIEGLVRRAVVPVADFALSMVGSFEGDPRVVISSLAHMLAGKLSDPKVAAVPRLLLREMVNFPELAAMYRREVLDRVIPVAERLIGRGIEQGYMRQVDPHLTIRSMVGPVLLHMLLADVFDIKPADGLAMQRFMENHLTILFDGLSIAGGAKAWTNS